MIRWLLCCFATAVAGLAALSPGASATFPGRNGEILFTQQQGRGTTSQARLIGLSPRTGVKRTLYECGQSAVAPACAGLSPPAISPDGRVAAISDGGAVLTLDLDSGASGQATLPPDQYPVTDSSGSLAWGPGSAGLSGAIWTFFPFTRTNRLIGLDGALGAEVAPADALSLDWSADGRLAYIRAGNLFVASPGEPERRLTWRGAEDPSWSPGGRRIAFTRKGQIHAIPTDGGRVTRLTGRGGERPAWSPDGRRIAFLRSVVAEGFGKAFDLHILTLNPPRVRRPGSEVLEAQDFAYPLHWVSAPEWRALP